MCCPGTCKHFRTRFGILTTRLESTEGPTWNHADLSCFPSCASLVAGSCFSLSGWRIADSSSTEFKSGLLSDQSSFGQKWGRCLDTTAGLWQSDALKPRPA